MAAIDNSPPQETATIYRFPLRGRFARTAMTNLESEARARSRDVDATSGWYHEEAIREEQSRH